MSFYMYRSMQGNMPPRWRIGVRRVVEKAIPLLDFAYIMN